MRLIKCFLLVAFFALWACQEEQFSQKEEQFDSSRPYPRVERLRTIKRVDNAPATRAVGVKDKFWQPGDTIRIKFQNADEYPELPEKVIQYAAIWLQYASLHFEYVAPSEEADVKIGFDMDDKGLSWSTIGTDCKQVPQDEVSLNFVDLEFAEDEDIQKEVLRGFGHVLGLGFEHRSPASPITLDEAKTLKYFKRQGLSEKDILNDILPYYNSDQTNYTDFDPQSIMLLTMPTTIQTGSGIRLNENYTLSSQDIIFIRDSLYPTPERTDRLMEITINGDLLSCSCTLNDEITIKYNDGYTETFTPGKDTGFFKRYFHQPGRYSVKIYGSDVAIEKLDMRQTHATSLILESNTRLKEIYCQNNELDSLDTSKCPALKHLECNQNRLTKLNLSQNENIQLLMAADNNLTALDVSNSLNIRYLRFENNFLTQLDVSKNKVLEYLDFENNQMESINLENNPNLTTLMAGHNKLKTLDLSHNSNISLISAEYNQLKEIIFGNTQQLDYLSCNNNKLTSLDVSGMSIMRFLYCHNNSFSISELENIANNINSIGGDVIYSPLNSTITQLFEQKNWRVLTPTSSYSSRMLANRNSSLLRNSFLLNE